MKKIAFLALLLLVSSLHAQGTLRVSTNPRYFTDDSGKAIYLTGSHTWDNFEDGGVTDPPPVFDFNVYLNSLQAYNHNFFRLWRAEQAKGGVLPVGDNYWFTPMPYARTGPGTALDGKPKYDLNQFNQAYFDRMRSRIVAAGQRGIYVSIMLFDGWSVVAKVTSQPWTWHPLNLSNNINGVNGDPNGNSNGEETQLLTYSALVALSEAYAKKVIDTVNDLDNVLYEIDNEGEGAATPWQYHMISYIKSYEAGLPKQHPVGMTVEWPGGTNAELFSSVADWISPNGDVNNPPVFTGTKVVLNDTDHLCGICGTKHFVWKTMMQGGNPIYMDKYEAGITDWGSTTNNDPNDPNDVAVRKSMGWSLTYAKKIDLINMVPSPGLTSTGYCLAKTGSSAEYLVYQPAADASFTVNLKGTTGVLSVEWLNGTTEAVVAGPDVNGGATRTFSPPFSSDAVLYLKSSTATGLPDLTITKSHVGNFTQGQNGNYTITVSNVGTSPSDGAVSVTDTLPTGFSLVSLTGAGWNCAGLTCNRSDGLANGSNYPTLNMTVAVAANASSGTNVVAVLGGGETNTGNNSANDFTNVVVSTPNLVISNVGSSNITKTSAQITWTTNIVSNSQVVYGTTTNYGKQGTNSTLVTSHIITLTGLKANTLYDYRVKSTANGTTVTSNDFTFTTPGQSNNR